MQNWGQRRLSILISLKYGVALLLEETSTNEWCSLATWVSIATHGAKLCMATRRWILRALFLAELYAQVVADIIHTLKRFMQLIRSQIRDLWWTPKATSAPSSHIWCFIKTAPTTSELVSIRRGERLVSYYKILQSLESSIFHMIIPDITIQIFSMHMTEMVKLCILLFLELSTCSWKFRHCAIFWNREILRHVFPRSTAIYKKPLWVEKTIKFQLLESSTIRGNSSLLSAKKSERKEYPLILVIKTKKPSKYMKLIFSCYSVETNPQISEHHKTVSMKNNELISESRTIVQEFDAISRWTENV